MVRGVGISNVERLVLVLLGGAVFLAIRFEVTSPLGLLVWVGLGLALTFPPAFALSLLHAFFVRRLPEGLPRAARRLLSVVIGGGCVVLIPILLALTAPVDTSPSLGGLFVISLGFVYGAVAKLMPASDGSRDRLTPDDAVRGVRRDAPQ
jgi:hypothetical protein